MKLHSLCLYFMVVSFFRHLCPVCGMVIKELAKCSEVFSAVEHIEYFREHFKIIYYLTVKHRTAVLEDLFIK